MIALIDGDSVAYRPAASCEPTKVKLEREGEEFAIARCNDLMHRILHETGAEKYELFIGGGRNFRYDIDPNYKANRKDSVRPQHLEAVREHLVSQWGAKVCDGIEAEDAVGIANASADEDTVMVHIDKDLNQLPGNHHNYVTHEHWYVTPLDGLKSFYTQLVLGDRVDNIMGYDGLMRQKCPKFLQPIIDAIYSATSEYEMYEIVHDIYELGDEALLRNGKLLYLQREVDSTWTIPTLGSHEVSD